MPLFGKKTPPKTLPKGLENEKNLRIALQNDRFQSEKQESHVCWLHRNTNRNLAEHKLSKGGKHSGYFLVRESLCRQHDFVLSLVHEKKYYHYEIKRQPTEGNTYSIEDAFRFKGLDQLIEHYKTSGVKLPTPLKNHCKGELPHPYNCFAGYTNLLHKAISAAEAEIAMKILDHPLHPDVNAKNAEGSTALHDACKRGMVEVVERLLFNGASGIMTDAEGYTPLQVACQNNQPKIVELLVTRGRMDPQDRHPQTLQVALHYAAVAGHTPCVLMLLEHGAAAYPRDKEGFVPSELAHNNQQSMCASIIENYNPPPATTHRKLWFHNVTREVAERLLSDKGLLDGLFLIRRSSRNKQNYVLVLAYEFVTKSYEIQCTEGLYFIDDGPLLPSLEHLVEYYCLRADGLCCRLVMSLTQDGQVLVPYESQTVPLDQRDGTYYNTPENLRFDQLSIDDGPMYQLVGVKNGKAGNKQKPPPVLDQPMNIDPDSINIGYELGQGEYGSVLSGEWTSPDGKKIKVAIKTLHSDYMASSKENFLREAKVMVKLNHPCIVQLIGVCPGQPVMLVQELMPMGSLLDYLLDYPERIKPNPDLYVWAAQVAAGMGYLEKQGFVHRDLAARNILLKDRRHAKVGDFGLSRAMESESNYYRATVGGRWPVKWYAPECVNYGTFSSASDVWSYGVTLWEMFSFGDQPYGKMIGAQVVAFLEKGNRLEQPPDCPDAVYQTMLQCWEYEPKNRPTFGQLFHKFQTDPQYEVSDAFFNLMDYTVGATSL